MREPAPSQITRLLQLWGEGNREALNQVMPVVYERLRQIAHHRLRNGLGEGSLNTSDLVHEAYLKLVDAPRVSLKDRSHFLALVSRVMRNLLVDHARARQAAKRGGGQTPAELESGFWISDEKVEVVVELDQALQRLEALDERQSRILEQRYFGGLSLEETAVVFGISLATVKRELRSARAWLAAELRSEPVL